MCSSQRPAIAIAPQECIEPQTGAMDTKRQHTLVFQAANSAWISDAIVRITPAMQAIETHLLDTEAHVSILRDEVKEIARKENLLYNERINSRHMGVHSENRYGDGIVPADVHALVEKIFAAGAPRASLQDPTCSEVPPIGHSRHEVLVNFNNAVMASSLGLLLAYADPLRAV